MLIIPSFLISSPSLKFTIFLYLLPIGHFDIADPSSMQDACHYELINMTYARRESPSSSVVRASDRCTEGHGFVSRRGLRFLFVPRSRDVDYSIFSYDRYPTLLFNKLSLCPYMVRKPSISVILNDRYPAIYVNDHIWKCTADFLSLLVWRPF